MLALRPRLDARGPPITPLKLRPPVSPPNSPPSSPPGSPRSIDSKDVQKELQTIVVPKMKLSTFVAEAQEQFPRLTLPQLQQYWRIQNLRRPVATAKRKGQKVGRKGLSTFDRIDEELSGVQERALQDLFYRQHKGTIGVQALWEVLRQEPWQEAALEKGKGAITWRTLRAWYNAQATNQLHRKAKPMSKTLVNVPTAEQLVPFARLQLDTLVMAKGNNKKGDDDLGWQTTSKKTIGLPDSKQRVVYNMIDLASNYNWLNAGPRAPNTDDAIDSVKEFIDSIKDMHPDGEWPRKTVLYVDGGPEYSEAFQDAIENFEPLITIRVQEAYNPNSNAYIEGSMSLLRRTMKRHAENMKAGRSGSKNYLSYWFNKPNSGKAGQLLAEMNALMNTRPVKALGWQTPADVLKGYLDGDDKIVLKAKESKLSTANKRRSSAKITKYKTGDKVRLISNKYLKSAGSRDNLLKQNPPWSRELYTISSVQGGIDMVPKYRLEEKGDVWYLHHQLQKIDEGLALPPPLDIVSEDMDYEPYKGLSHTPLRLFYRGFPMAELEEHMESA